MHRRLASSVIFAVLFSGVSALSADVVVATWPSFSGDQIYASGGQQAGTASITGSFGVATTGGSSLYPQGSQSSFDVSMLDISFTRSGLHNFDLTYDVFRTDGQGVNHAPTSIQWSFSVDGGTLVPVTSQSVEVGANGHSIDFASFSAINAGANVVFHAKFAGSYGTGESTIRFDNFRISAVPEPGSLLALALAGASSLLINRRRRA